MVDRTLKFEILLYVGLFIFGLVLFSLLRVPSDRLAGITVAYAAAAGYDLEYDEVGSTLLPGFKLYGVRLFGEDKKAPVLELGSLSARTAVLPLFTGKAGLLVGAEGYGGTADVNVRTRGEQAWVSGSVQGVNLENFPAIQEKLKLPVKGTIDADFDLELAPVPVQSVGNIDLHVNDLLFDQGMLLGTFKFPGADFGDVNGTLLLENGKLVFDRFAGEGQDVKAVIEGEIVLREPVAYSNLDVTLKLGLSKRIEEALGFAFPLLNLTKTPQGEYVRRVGGTLVAPR